jgi:hypothetical protein
MFKTFSYRIHIVYTLYMRVYITIIEKLKRDVYIRREREREREKC